MAPVKFSKISGCTEGESKLAPWPSPGTLNNYSVGFECQDLCGRHDSGIPLDLSKSPNQFMADIGSRSRSQKMLMVSLVTIRGMLPRTALIENVVGWPTRNLIENLQ